MQGDKLNIFVVWRGVNKGNFYLCRFFFSANVFLTMKKNVITARTDEEKNGEYFFQNNCENVLIFCEEKVK